jgi:hypothetical protein
VRRAANFWGGFTVLQAERDFCGGLLGIEYGVGMVDSAWVVMGDGVFVTAEGGGTQKRQTRVSLPLMKIKLERCRTYFR